LYIQVSAISGHSIPFSHGTPLKEHAQPIYHDDLNLSNSLDQGWCVLFGGKRAGRQPHDSKGLVLRSSAP
jgi:hypothetical protein